VAIEAARGAAVIRWEADWRDAAPEIEVQLGDGGPIVAPRGAREVRVSVTRERAEEVLP
jgi:hypothetical protein